MMKTLLAIRPNAGLTARYNRRLASLIEEMHGSALYWIRATWRANTPESLAQDVSPAAALRSAMRRLARRWQSKFDKLAPDLARYFATAASSRVDATLREALKAAGVTISFKMTAAQNDVLQATIADNVALIRSIPQEHFKSVQGVVLRSVATGRDIGALTRELEDTYGVTKRRAAFIARQQNNLATATLTKTRQTELGVTKAVWQHSAGGKKPRPEHVAFSGKTYDVAKGAYLEGKWTWPGVEPRCRCVSLSVIPGWDAD